MSGRHQPLNGADSPDALREGQDRRAELHGGPPHDHEYRVEADPAGWMVWRPDDEDRVAFRTTIPETARYAAMLLNSGLEPEELDGMLVRVRCSYCHGMKYAAELDVSGRCVECQS